MSFPNPTPLPSFHELTDSQKMLVISTTLNELSAKVYTDHKLLVEGNGTPSIMERVRNLEEYVDNLKYWARFIAGAIVLQTITFTGAAIFYFIRLYPMLERLASKP